jgi:hypothetical protein
MVEVIVGDNQVVDLFDAGSLAAAAIRIASRFLLPSYPASISINSPEGET